MRFAFVVTVCSLAMGCSSSSTNEAPAGGGAAGSGGATGGSGGATGGSGGAAGGSGGATGGSGGATGGSGGSTGGSGGTGGAPVCIPGNSTGFLNCAPHKPSSMAVDSTHVYFALAAGGVEYLFRAPKAGISAPLSPWAKIGGGSVGDIVVSTSHVFVATTDENRQLIRYALADANETVLLDKTGCAAPFPDAPLAIDKTAVYYACKGTKSAIGMFKTGSSTGELAFTYPGSYVISGLGSNGSVLAIALGSLDYLPLPGGSAGLTDANDTYTRAAMIGNKIYAMTATTVKTFNYGGAGDADALSGLTGLVDFRVDATGIYAITNNKVVGKPLSQGTLSLNQTATPGGIALDATHVYWSSPTGLIERVAR